MVQVVFQNLNAMEALQEGCATAGHRCSLCRLCGLQVTRSVHLQNISVSHTVGDPLDYSALTGLDFHECAACPMS